MLNKSRHRKIFRNCLLAINLCLVLSIIILCCFGALIVKPSLIARATKIKQYLIFDLNNLPQNLNDLEPDYIGPNHHNVISKHHEADEVVADKLNPRIALIITNIGLNKRINDLALTMPSQIAFGILPYSNRVQHFINEADLNNHEVYIYLPLSEGHHNKNSGSESALPLLKGEDSNFNLGNLLGISNRITGLYTNANETLANDLNVFESIMDQIEGRNLILIFGKTNYLLSNRHHLNRKNLVQAGVIIDNELDEKKIITNLDKLVYNARNNNSALGYASGTVITMETIKKWLLTLEAKGVELVPVSSLLKGKN